jgi:hypothetical protein
MTLRMNEAYLSYLSVSGRGIPISHGPAAFHHPRPGRRQDLLEHARHTLACAKLALDGLS